MQFAAVLRSRIAVSLITASAFIFVAGPASSASSSAVTERSHAPDRLLVKFKPHASPAEIARAMGSTRVTEISTIHDLDVHVMSVPPSRLDGTLSTLRHSPSVLYAEYDGIMQAADTIPNDPSWPSQSSQVHLRTPQAWDYSTGASSVVIAVLDTGVDPTTPDLQGSFVAGYDFVNNDADPSDDHGHGTMAAGVAAARGNNGLGIAGYCWSCSIMPIKVMTAAGTGLQSTLATGITWATDHGARVISMSVSGGAYTTLASAVKYAHSKGVVLVAAAGNNGNSTQSYPAAYPEVLGAAGSNPDDTLNSYSNYGSWVKIAAPWCNYAPSVRQPDGSYRYSAFCGTSSATPAAAGIAGLAFSYAPMSSNTAVEQALESSALPVSGASQVAYGRIDAFGTMLAFGAAAPPPAGTAPTNATAPAINGLTAEGQMLTASTGSWNGSTPMTFAFRWQRCESNGSACIDIAGANTSIYVVGSADIGCTLRTEITASNSYGTASTSSAPSALVTGNQPSPPPASTPAAASFAGSLNKKQSSKAFTVSVGGGDAKASLAFTKTSSLTLTVLAADGSTVGSANGPSVLTLVKTLPAGAYQYVVAAGGGVNASFTLTLTYTAP
jgi:subtilisin family serine protease